MNNNLKNATPDEVLVAVREDFYSYVVKEEAFKPGLKYINAAMAKLSDAELSTMLVLGAEFFNSAGGVQIAKDIAGKTGVSDECDCGGVHE